MKLGSHDTLRLSEDGKRLHAPRKSKSQQLKDHPTNVARRARKEKFDALCWRRGWNPNTVRKRRQQGDSLLSILRRPPKRHRPGGNLPESWYQQSAAWADETGRQDFQHKRTSK